LFRANPSFVTIDPIEDIESLLKFGTEDNLMIGTATAIPTSLPT